ncbi:hypothetical protein NONO_c27250 [Nocardia nova SH22a]|uniref:EthD domain-containing protein n=1 Tax=Nocardia nova SH22a TaxID=1415166 RepID=W5TE66_9NOCA|nr:EthD family reductase [Nocardia nova]AHH17517.1 hypothetical protein NONO_c27250 [Nocardia nova SH22a]
MGYQITALYNRPADTAAFDAHYDDVHAPLTLELPGLRTFSVSRPGPGADGAEPAFYLIAVLGFDDQATAEAGLTGPVGRRALADLETFAQAGVTILTGPSEELA